MRKYIIPVLISIAILAFAGVGINDIVSTKHKAKLQEIEIQSKDSRLKNLQYQYEQLNVQLDKAGNNKAKLEELRKQKEKLDRENDELRSQLSAQEESKRQTAEKLKDASSLSQPAYAAGNCGDNKYKQFIYQKESGCRTDAVNSIGCVGIAQSCPASKLTNVCPNWRNDFACQDRFFSNYAVSRYGSWANAYNFWTANNWW